MTRRRFSDSFCSSGPFRLRALRWVRCRSISQAASSRRPSSVLDRQHVGGPQDHARRRLRESSVRWASPTPPAARASEGCTASSSRWLSGWSGPRLLFRVVLLLSMGIGLFALYLCQVRSLLVMLLPAFFASVGRSCPSFAFGRVARPSSPRSSSPLSWPWRFAVAVGGDTVTDDYHADRKRSSDPSTTRIAGSSWSRR